MTQRVAARRRRVVPLPVLLMVGVVVVVLGAAVALIANHSSAGSAADETASEARAASDSGDFQGAEVMLRERLSSDEDDVDARRQLAEVLASEGDNEEALEQYAQVVDADAEDHESLVAMASIEQVLGDAEAAAKHLEAALAVEQDPSYYRALAPIYVSMGKWDEAIATWRTYLDIAELGVTDQAAVHAAIAAVYEDARDYEQARESLKVAVRLDPSNAEYQSRLEVYGD